MKAGSGLLTIGLMLASGTATAQSEPPAALKTLVASAPYQANIARLFAGLPPEVFQRCSGLLSKGSIVTIMAPVSFAADGYPISGMWRQSFPVSGCGNDTTINFFFRGQPDEKIVGIVAAPGDTHADLVLQRDAMGFVRIAAQTEIKGCNALYLRTTSFVGVVGTAPGAPLAQASQKAPWQERWDVAGCGQVVRVHVDFIPDATGTTISTHIDKPNKP